MKYFLRIRKLTLNQLIDVDKCYEITELSLNIIFVNFPNLYNFSCSGKLYKQNNRVTTLYTVTE